MEKKKLKEFVSFVPGINPTRTRNQYGELEKKYYDQSSFEEDYRHEEMCAEDEKNITKQKGSGLNECDVVVSNSIQRATMVSKKNKGKVLSLNFTKIEFKGDQLDKRYFLFLFNVYRDVSRQKERELQGSGTILRIPIRSLEEIIIPVIPLYEQRKIGSIYVETLKLQSKLTRYGDLMEVFTNSIIEECLKGN